MKSFVDTLAWSMRFDTWLCLLWICGVICVSLDKIIRFTELEGLSSSRDVDRQRKSATSQAVVAMGKTVNTSTRCRTTTAVYIRQ